MIEHVAVLSPTMNYLKQENFYPLKYNKFLEVLQKESGHSMSVPILFGVLCHNIYSTGGTSATGASPAEASTTDESAAGATSDVTTSAA